MKRFLIVSVLFIIVVVGAASSATLLGARKCTYGPSYWCSSLEAAKECSALKHCIKNKWAVVSVWLFT